MHAAQSTSARGKGRMQMPFKSMHMHASNTWTHLNVSACLSTSMLNTMSSTWQACPLWSWSKRISPMLRGKRRVSPGSSSSALSRAVRTSSDIYHEREWRSPDGRKTRINRPYRKCHPMKSTVHGGQCAAMTIKEPQEKCITCPFFHPPGARTEGEPQTLMKTFLPFSSTLLITNLHVNSVHHCPVCSCMTKRALPVRQQVLCIYRHHGVFDIHSITHPGSGVIVIPAC